jgi:hypothetical protein
MGRRIFISYQHDDHDKAKGFNLLRWNKNVDIEFVGRHLLSPVDSTNEQTIKQAIREQLTGTSVTVVLLGDKTQQSEWVAWEVQQSLSKDKPNGLLAIKLDNKVVLDPSSAVGKILHDFGAETVVWDAHEFSAAIERAATGVGRAAAIRSTTPGGGGCIRT